MYIVELKVTQGKEQGALNYHWCANGNICQSLEHFDSNEAALSHLHTFSEKFATQYLSLGEVTNCIVYGSPNQEVKEILDGFGATYMTTLDSYSKK